MEAPETGPAVQKIQQALIDLDFPLPSFGDDGHFGSETGAQVTAFKRSQGISPSDPRVGPRTMAAFDSLLVDKPAAPFSDRDEWVSWSARPFGQFNFTRADMLALRQGGGALALDPISGWLPTAFVDALMFAVEAILDPLGSPAGRGTASALWGASPLDFYHGHVCVPSEVARNSSLIVDQHALAVKFEELMAQATAAGPEFSPAWRRAYAELLVSQAPPGQSHVLAKAASLLDEALSVASTRGSSAAIIFHTFECARWRPKTMISSDPRRGWMIGVPRNGGSVFPGEPDEDLLLGTFAHLMELAFLVDSTSAQIVVMPNSLVETAAVMEFSHDDILNACFAP
jgi:hypothetical protein